MELPDNGGLWIIRPDDNLRISMDLREMDIEIAVSKMRNLIKRSMRVKKARAKGRHTKQEWLTLLAEFGGHCARCWTTEDVGRDHIVPVSQGGSDAIANIQPLCRRCNSGKGPCTFNWKTYRRSLCYPFPKLPVTVVSGGQEWRGSLTRYEIELMEFEIWEFALPETVVSWQAEDGQTRTFKCGNRI